MNCLRLSAALVASLLALPAYAAPHDSKIEGIDQIPTSEQVMTGVAGIQDNHDSSCSEVARAMIGNWPAMLAQMPAGGGSMRSGFRSGFPPVLAGYAAARFAQGSNNDFLKSLNISDEQLEKFTALQDNYEECTAEKRTKLMLLHHQLRTAFSDASLDRDKIMSLQNKISSLQTDLASESVKYAIDSAQVFSVEQRQQLRLLLEKRQSKPMV